MTRRWLKLPGLAGGLFACRGCLGPIGDGAEAGLCAPCWEGLVPLDPLRCPRCALVHGDGDCPEPVAWARGEALWEYHGGRPPLGALLVPGIKAGEEGWRKALLRRLAEVPLPELPAVEAVVPVPTQTWKRLWRGFDLAESAADAMARRIGVPMHRLLRKAWRAPSQAGRSESRRRRLPAKAFSLQADPARIEGRRLLLVDDVWTTGTSLLRCARLLQGAGAEVAVLTLFRAT